jgi:hypothetical protein
MQVIQTHAKVMKQIFQGCIKTASRALVQIKKESWKIRNVKCKTILTSEIKKVIDNGWYSSVIVMPRLQTG